MKATMVLTPLALAMAAVLSVSAYAGNEGGWHPPKPNPQSNNKGGATALVVDTQQNYNNKVSNFGTVNNASVSGSIRMPRATSGSTSPPATTTSRPTPPRWPAPTPASCSAPRPPAPACCRAATAIR